MPGLRTPPLDLFAEHVVELGKLTRPVRHGANDCLSLGGIERHVNRSRGKRSLHLVRNGRIAASPQSADQLGNVVGLNGHAGHIDVAPQRHARWVSRSSNNQTWASGSPRHLSACGAWRPARHGAATPVVEAPVRHYRVVFIPDSRARTTRGRDRGGARCGSRIRRIGRGDCSTATDRNQHGRERQHRYRHLHSLPPPGQHAHGRYGGSRSTRDLRPSTAGLSATSIATE